MDYEQKYKAALERAKQFSEKPLLEDSAGIVEYIFPELKESEDEKVRKEIIDFATKANNGVTSILANNYDFNKWLTWLEKQGEQNHAEWSEEDENAIQVLKDIVKHSNEINENIYTTSLKEKLYDWLESLKPQFKQEWSEEDERLLSKLQTYVDLECFDRECNGQDLIDWLKSLKDRVQHQPHWKPTKEQMDALWRRIAEIKISDERVSDMYILSELHEQLENL